MNTYTILDARLVANPKTIDANGKTLVTLRIADNPQGLKKDADPKDKRRARFVTLKAWEKQGELMAKLSKNDVISVSGELVKEVFLNKDKDEQEDDVMRVVSFRVQKSDSFYGGAQDQGEEDRPADTSGKKKSPF